MMRGSLGIWMEPSGGALGKPGKLAPELEIHVNLWRNLGAMGSFIDFGFLIKKAESMERFMIYIPTSVNKNDVYDLGPTLKYEGTLNAVFNDTISITKNESDKFTAIRSSGIEFCVHNFNVDNDIGFEKIPLEDDSTGTIISFDNNMCKRLIEGVTENYIRMRILLKDDSSKIFYDKLVSPDGVVHSTSYDLELNEFRLNERRSFPNSLVQWSKGQDFRISRVLFFLIRGSDSELVVEHSHFHRTRRLENSIWANYIFSHIDGQILSRKEKLDNYLKSQMLIYQWKEVCRADSDGDTKWISDFSAFSIFRSPKDNVIYYLMFAFAIGAAGSALSAIIIRLIGGFALGRIALDIGEWGTFSFLVVASGLAFIGWRRVRG